MHNICMPLLNHMTYDGFITSFMFSPCCNSDTRHGNIGQVIMDKCYLRFYSDDNTVNFKIRVPNYNTWETPRQTEFDIWHQYLQNWYMRPVVFNNVLIGPFNLQQHPSDKKKKCYKINVEFGIDSGGRWQCAQNAYIELHLGTYYKNKELGTHYDSTAFGLGYYTGRKGWGSNWGFTRSLYVFEEEAHLLNADNKDFHYWLKSCYMEVDGKDYLYKI